MMEGTKIYVSVMNRHVRLMGLSIGPHVLGVDVIKISYTSFLTHGPLPTHILFFLTLKGISRQFVSHIKSVFASTFSFSNSCLLILFQLIFLLIDFSFLKQLLIRNKKIQINIDYMVTFIIADFGQNNLSNSSDFFSSF